MKEKFQQLWGKTKAKLAEFKHDFHQIYGKNRFRDQNLLKAYVGKNYEKFATRRFNVAGFFLSSLYMFYRKMRWSAILVFILQVSLIAITKSLVIREMAPNIAVDIFHQLIISLLVGFLVNKFYLWDAEHKIAILKLRFPHATHAELRGICMARGGTSVAVAVPWVVLEVLISTAIAVAMLIGEILSGVSNSVENFEHEVQNTVESGIEMLEPSHKNSAKPDGLKGKITELIKKIEK